MVQDVNNAQHYTAGENKTFVNKESGIRYGNDLYLSTEDVIENYTEEPMSEDEIKAMKEQNNNNQRTET